MMKNTRINNISNLALNGGQPSSSMYSRTMGVIKNMDWKMYLAIIVITFILLFIVYYYYKQYNSNLTSYNANRENGYAEGSKDAEMILFYVDWCPHCKTAKPEWENIKTEYEGKTINGYTLIFTEHNCTTETPEIEALINKYKIEGYPTIKLIKDNQVIEYDAKPTKTTMETFINTVI